MSIPYALIGFAIAVDTGPKYIFRMHRNRRKAAFLHRFNQMEQAAGSYYFCTLQQLNSRWSSRKPKNGD